MKSNKNYDRIREDIIHNRQLDIFAYNRPGKKVGGGVCIVFNPLKLKLEENKFPKYGLEIVSAKGTIIGLNRKIVLYTVYLPPNLGVIRAKEALQIINMNIF